MLYRNDDPMAIAAMEEDRLREPDDGYCEEEYDDYYWEGKWDGYEY